MLRIHGRLSLAAALISAGLTNAAPPAAKSAESDKVMTLTSEDGKPRRCQILTTSKHPSGGTAYEVKADDTGEIFTVIENVPLEKVVASLPAPTVSDGPPKAPVGDPIMKPVEYNGSDLVQKQMGIEKSQPPKTVVKYDKPPQPVTKRWFASKKVEPKPVAKPITTMVAAPPAIESARHPDPVIRMIAGLRDETLPSLREYAAENLATGPGRHRSEVADALIAAARHDPAPSVRACCARCLAEMDVRSPACVSALNTLKNDEDEMVRTAADSALMRIRR